MPLPGQAGAAGADTETGRADAPLGDHALRGQDRPALWVEVLDDVEERISWACSTGSGRAAAHIVRWTR